MAIKYYYRKTGDSNVHFTSRSFRGWSKKQVGNLTVRQAIFGKKNNLLVIPEYMLTKDTRAVLNQLKTDN